MTHSKIGLVIFDLAGTTVDYGCIAPVAAFVEGFRKMQVPISLTQARAPMGMAADSRPTGTGYRY